MKLTHYTLNEKTLAVYVCDNGIDFKVYIDRYDFEEYANVDGQPDYYRAAEINGHILEDIAAYIRDKDMLSYNRYLTRAKLEDFAYNEVDEQKQNELIQLIDNYAAAVEALAVNMMV